MERLMRRRLADWIGFAGVLALVAAFVLPLARAQWNTARPWVFAAGALLVLTSILLRLDYGRRVTRYGLNSALLVILVIGVIAFVEAISYRHNARLDLTENRRHSLSPQTIQLLKGLESDVAATAFYRSDQPGKKVAEDLLKQYASYSGGKFTWKMTDPDREPGLARRYGVESYGTIVLEAKNRSEKVLDAEEEKLTNGLVKATRGSKRTVYVIAGHGELELGNTERHGFSEAKTAMERSNYDVKELVLAREATVPDDAAVVVLAGPRTDLFKPELDALETYLGRGGKLFVMANPFQSAGLSGWLAKHGFVLDDDLVIEASPLGQLFGIGPEVPIVQQYEPHPITRDMRGLNTLFPLTRSLKPGAPGGKYHVQTLAMTSPQSWGETDKAALDRGQAQPGPGDPRGPLAVAAVGTADKARIVVFGTATLASNQFLNIQGNRDLFLNTVSWLAEEEDLISIRPKDAKQTPVMLTSQQHQFVFLVPVVLLPAVALIAGVIVFARRRAAK
jgi:ABC-type uncharacterized transport system involved in gliding motility auxiliary subunit